MKLVLPALSHLRASPRVSVHLHSSARPCASDGWRRVLRARSLRRHAAVTRVGVWQLPAVQQGSIPFHGASLPRSVPDEPEWRVGNRPESPPHAASHLSVVTLHSACKIPSWRQAVHASIMYGVNQSTDRGSPSLRDAPCSLARGRQHRACNSLSDRSHPTGSGSALSNSATQPLMTHRVTNRSHLSDFSHLGSSMSPQHPKP